MTEVLPEQREFEDVALFDMDGTLADFDKAMREQMARLAAPWEKDLYLIESDDEPAYIKARRRLIKCPSRAGTSPGSPRSQADEGTPDQLPRLHGEGPLVR